ncbi:uncharacterized protein LOC110876681 [Helianthus annuus]|uniref:uncharacterized protein LOC110876681 n=1 Tax=Helianthus annuus TaxID=4232 RepID=UPI000B8FE6F2|nr:uncharacterized protein LOC110876681 [Helianthus annuus]
MAARSLDRKRKAVAPENSGEQSFSNEPADFGVQTTGQLVRRSSMLRAAANQRSIQSLTSVQPEMEQYEGPSTSSFALQLPGPSYVDLGDCINECEYCGAFFWFEERLKSSPLKQRPRYNTCCKAGSVRIPFPVEPPSCIKELYSSSQFMVNIRAYNSMFSMTSFGADVDDTINHSAGPYVFKVSGQISHWIGSLCPSAGEKPRFLQMYVYDTLHEVENILRFFNSDDQHRLSPDVVSLLTRTLAETNEFVRLFKSAADLCSQQQVPEFAITLYNRSKQNIYGLPVAGTLGAIVRDNDPLASDYDIVVHSKDGRAKRVSKLHSSYMPLQYPLLFPYAEPGWSPELQLTLNSRAKDRNLTMNMFYAYQIHDRKDTYTLLLNAGRLFQQYLVDAYVCIEQCRLEYIRTNQNKFRSEFLRGIHDAFSKGDTEGREVGKRIILPSSFTGGPRYMYKHYQDALAICRVHGNPQYFITFTCSVKWPEIKRYLNRIGGANSQDRPDIIARVFQMKVEALLKFLKTHETFGKVAADILLNFALLFNIHIPFDLYTIEFQKRGLPHCHMLLWVTPECKIQTAEDVDNFISAEIPNPTTDPVLYRIVTESMMHGPCGLPKMNAPCMIDGKCSKSFPKAYEHVTRFDEQGYIHYKRSLNGIQVDKGGVPLDNGYVVPYNRILCLRFEAHINVEYCGWSMLIKYLFKYISKGADRVRYAVTRTAESSTQSDTNVVENINEINNFVDGRFICPHEAAWRILQFPIHNRNPPVQLLAVHLEHMQNVTFKDNQKLQQILTNPATSKTTLTEWLRNNQLDPSGRDLRYIDYVSRYRWEPSGKGWIRRLLTTNPTIGRLAYIHPTCGEPFYLRLLLAHQTGCCSFEDIRTVSGVLCSTYRLACEKLGLIGNDREWASAFIEASSWATSVELRALFVHMLLYCEISNPLALWQEHWERMSDDIILNLRQVAGTSNAHFCGPNLQQYVLYEIEMLLNSNTSSRSLAEFGLPMPPDTMVAALRNRLLMEERCYDLEALAAQNIIMLRGLNDRQRKIYDKVLKSVNDKVQVLLFVYGHGGTGKTYLWTAIIAALRSTGKIVLAVAASGIASLLLPSGRTAHSRFKIPLDLTDDSLCNIKKHTQLAQLLLETSLIIWDEAPMSDRRCFESLDKSLRDVLGNQDKPFGGKSVLLGGDFRQTLPVKPKASKAEIIASSLPKSYLWDKFSIHMLTENMRLSQSNATVAEKEAITSFSNWLIDVGDGKIGAVDEESPSDSKFIDIPAQYLIQSGENGLRELIRFVYDDNLLEFPTSITLSERAIVCPRNDTADQINDMILASSPGECSTYLSLDSMVPHSQNGGETDMMYPPEYLNLLNINGIPPHCLKLKVNAPALL